MMSFPGTAATGIDFGTSATLNATSFSISAWVYRAGNGNTAATGTGGLTGTTAAEPIYTRGVGQADGSNVDANYFLGLIPASLKFAADFEDLNTGLNHPFIFTTAQSATGLYHVVVTYDGGASNPGNWAGYVNGAADGTATVTSATLNVRKPRNDSIQKVGIGVAINSTGTRTGGWNGNIIEVAFWKDKVITAAEVSAIYNAKLKGHARQIQPAYLNGYWLLGATPDGTTVSTSAGAIKDSSASNNSGTAFGTITGKAEVYLNSF